MAQEISNFGRFYSAFNRLRYNSDPEETKRQFVSQYTGRRTASLKEMTRKEYSAMCAALERMNGDRDELRRRRSITLKLMQELEVDTGDWAQINDFCRHPRIAGKEFGRLSIEEQKDLAAKLRAIKRKGWQRKKSGPTPASPKQQITYLINLAPTGMTNKN